MVINRLNLRELHTLQSDQEELKFIGSALHEAILERFNRTRRN